MKISNYNENPEINTRVNYSRVKKFTSKVIYSRVKKSRVGLFSRKLFEHRHL